MAAPEQRDDRLLRVFPQNVHSRLGGKNGLLAVPYSINGRQQNAVMKPFDQVHIPGHFLPGQRPRCDVPINQLLILDPG